MMAAHGMEFPTFPVGANSMAVSVGAGVKVGRRVLVAWTTNCAASVGSMVEVAGGTGVGGGSIT